MAVSFLFGPYQNIALAWMVVITALALLIVPLFLIHNGIVMIQREGFRLPNLLSLWLLSGTVFSELRTYKAFGNRPYFPCEKEDKP